MTASPAQLQFVVESAPSGFLSDNDLYALTERRQKAKIAAELTRMGIRFLLSPSDRPLVLWASIEERVGLRGSRRTDRAQQLTWKPDALLP